MARAVMTALLGTTRSGAVADLEEKKVRAQQNALSRQPMIGSRPAETPRAGEDGVRDPCIVVL